VRWRRTLDGFYIEDASLAAMTQPNDFMAGEQGPEPGSADGAAAAPHLHNRDCVLKRVKTPGRQRLDCPACIWRSPDSYDRTFEYTTYGGRVPGREREMGVNSGLPTLESCEHFLFTCLYHCWAFYFDRCDPCTPQKPGNPGKPTGCRLMPPIPTSESGLTGAKKHMRRADNRDTSTAEMKNTQGSS
jgi:hypothetical protein